MPNLHICENGTIINIDFVSMFYISDNFIYDEVRNILRLNIHHEPLKFTPMVKIREESIPLINYTFETKEEAQEYIEKVSFFANSKDE